VADGAARGRRAAIGRGRGQELGVESRQDEEKMG